MKVKELLTEVIGPKIGSEAFTSAMQSENFLDVDLGEEAEKIKGHLGGLITVETALNSPDIIKTINDKNSVSLKNSIYSSLDEPVNALATTLGVNFDDGDKMHQKLEKLQKVDLGFKESDKIKRLTEENARINNEFKAFRNEAEENLKKQQSEFTQSKIKDAQINFLASNYQLADGFNSPEAKEIVFATVLKKASDKAIILDGLEVRNKENPELKLMDNNNPVDFKKLIDPFMQEYLKKSPSPSPKPNTPNVPAAQTGNMFTRSFAAKKANMMS